MLPSLKVGSRLNDPTESRWVGENDGNVAIGFIVGDEPSLSTDPCSEAGGTLGDKFERPDVAAVVGLGHTRHLDRAGDPALVNHQTPCTAMVDGRTVWQQCVRPRRATIVLQWAQARVLP